MKKIIKKLLPRCIINALKDSIFFFSLKVTYCSDALDDFLVKCNLNQSYAKLEARIVVAAHVIEKGLSLKNVRLGYGATQIYYILELLDRYVKRGFSKDKFSFMFAVSILKAYIDFHESKNYDPGELGKKIKNFLKDHCRNVPLTWGGYEIKTKNEVVKKAGGDFKDFFNSRYSVRHYSGTSVPTDEIVDAVSIAQKAPSACNRQSCRVYIIKDQELKKNVLSLHKGNRGFGDTADSVLIVTSESSYFSLLERNQTYIDGGIFAMALLSALHYKGIAACPLAWSVEKRRDRALKKLCIIPYSERVVLLITLGNYPDTFQVAKSARRSVSDIITIK
jgi:nitroreductase